VLTLRFPRDGSPGNPEFGQEVSKVWPRIVPPRNRTQVLINNTFFGGAH